MDRAHAAPATTAAGQAHALLRRGAAQLGLPAASEDRVLAQLDRYGALLALWGQKMNLTAVAIQDPVSVAVQHFLDSMALVAQLPLAVTEQSLIDVGSGAGFPGVICALLRPELRVTLVERVGKKAAFLMTVRRELGLSYAVESCDVERLIPAAVGAVPTGTPARGFDLVVSRAAIPVPRWLPLGKRLVAPGGRVFAMTSLHEPLPQPPEGLTLAGDMTYDVGAGPRRILSWCAADAA